MELNTENCCFICLRSIQLDLVNKTSSSSVYPYKIDKTSLKIVCKLLKLDVDIILKQRNQYDPLETDLKVSLCEICRQVSRKLSKLFTKLEAIYLETDYYVGEMHKRISNSYKDAELVQNYSRRMTSSPEALKQLLTVDNLRKLFSQKCCSTRFTPFSVKLELRRCRQEYNTKGIHSDMPISQPIVKSEGEDVSDQEVETDYEMNFSSVVTEDDDPLNEINAPNLKLESFDTEETNAQDSPPMPQPATTKQSVKSIVKLTTSKHKCPKCNKILSSKHKLERHIQHVHLKKRIKCKICGVLISPDTFCHHMRICDPIKHQKLLEKQQEYKFKCTTCNRGFPSKECLTRHTNTVHLNIRRFSCNLCNKQFKLSHHLRIHNECVHLGIKYICQFCNKRCWTKYELSSHEKKCSQKN